MKKTQLGAISAVALGMAGQASADIVDLTSTGSFGVINLARYEAVNVRTAGTGVINPFVRIQNGGTEQGYNTSARPTPFDEKSGNFTRDITLGELGTCVVDGTEYLEFLLDINQSQGGNNSLLSLDQVKIFTSSVASQSTTDVSALGTLRYDMDEGGDNWVRLDSGLSTGSGQDDMRLLVPRSVMGGAAPETFVYLYSQFGTHHDSNGGFEEWAVSGVVPGPGAGLALAGIALVGRRRRR